nr:MAG TPA: hypothetical protein [Caudoviricetes sp.]
MTLRLNKSTWQSALELSQGFCRINNLKTRDLDPRKKARRG